MANHGYGFSLSHHSHTSEDESSEHDSQSLATLAKGTSHLVGGSTVSPSIAQSKKPSPSPERYIIDGGGGGSGSRSNVGGGGGNRTNHHKKPQIPKKPRGRPRGSKNKPKPPITITGEDDQALKPVIIEISVGCDVVEELIQFAQRRDAGLTVLSASGSVTNVTLRHTLPHAPSFILHGTFTVLSLSGTYIYNNLPSSSASSSTSLPNPLPVIPWPGYSSFTICLAGAQGQVLGGVIAGRTIAASLVVVVALLYKKPMLHRVPNKESDGFVVDLSDAEALQGGMNNSAMALSSSFNVMCVSPLNYHAPSNVNVNAMQWGHPNHPPSS